MRTCCRWLLLTIVLAVVGAGTFIYVRYRPRASLSLQHSGEVQVCADGDRVIACDGDDGPIIVWDTRQDRIVAVHRLDARFITWTHQPHLGLVAALLDNGSVRLVDAENGTMRTVETGMRRLWCDIRLSPDGRWLKMRNPADD